MTASTVRINATPKRKQSARPGSKKSARRSGRNLPAVISLFSGAGGLDLGFVQSGFELAIALDSSRAAIATHRRNFGEHSGFVADLAELGVGGVMKLITKRVTPGARVGVIGGPPCQGYSRANNRSSRDDPRNALTGLYLDIVERIATKYKLEFVVFENVVGITDRKNISAIQRVVARLEELQLVVRKLQLSALDFGVPQARERVIVTGLCSSYKGGSVAVRKSSGLTSVREAIGGLAEPAHFRREISVDDIPVHPNHWTMRPRSLKFSEPQSMRSSSRSFKLLSWDAPSPTVAYGHREIHVHPSGHRRLSIYEAMLLQGFPPSFVLEGNLSEQVTQVSNAVPPPLAKAVADAIKRSGGSPFLGASDE